MLNAFFLIHVLLYYGSLGTLAALVCVSVLHGGRILYLLSMAGAITGAIAFSLLGLLLQAVFSGFPRPLAVYVLPFAGAAVFVLVFIRLKGHVRE